MRLWSINPVYLDQKGLTACWREGLLAQKVLQGGTRGYKNHLQLDRFKSLSSPQEAIAQYLYTIYNEAVNRGYKYNKNKIGDVGNHIYKIPVTIGQIQYEYNLLQSKLLDRAVKKLYENIALKSYNIPICNDLFYPTIGDIESWEKIKDGINVV